MAKNYSVECVEEFTNVHEVKFGDGHLGYYRNRDDAEWAVLFSLRARGDKIASEINDRNQPDDPHIPEGE